MLKRHCKFGDICDKDSWFIIYKISFVKVKGKNANTRNIKVLQILFGKLSCIYIHTYIYISENGTKGVMPKSVIESATVVATVEMKISKMR